MSKVGWVEGVRLKRADSVIIIFFDDAGVSADSRELIVTRGQIKFDGSVDALDITDQQRLPEKGDIVVHKGRGYYIDDQVFNYEDGTLDIYYIASPSQYDGMTI